MSKGKLTDDQLADRRVEIATLKRQKAYYEGRIEYFDTEPNGEYFLPYINNQLAIVEARLQKLESEGQHE
jgi:hypothetical protein